jgi:hypothetical protein
MMRFPKLCLALFVLATSGCAMEARAPMEEAAAVASPTAAPAPEMAKADMAPPGSASLGRSFGTGTAGLMAPADEGGAGGKGAPERRRGAKAAPKKPAGDVRGGSGKDGAAAAEAKPKRMVHYNGNLRLKVTNASDVLNHAAKDCEDMGGYVETLTIDTVILRVPVAQFRPLFAKLLGLGEVMARSISAQDVTDAFTAMELRARILKASRDRLVALLAKATTARAKLDLLSEIRRLTEEIDQLDRYLTQIQSLAQFSRITLNVEVKTVAFDNRAQEPVAAFKWVHDLSPFKQGVAAANKRLELKVPKGMVELDRDDLWIAESADGARVWASQNKLGPAGTTDFWIDAVKSRLGPEYVTAEISTVGKFKVLRLVDEQSDNSYRYLVAVRADGKKLQVVEAYFMNAEQEKRYGDVVKAAIERGES